MADLRIKQYDFSKSPDNQSKYSHRIRPEQWEDNMPFIVAMFREGLTRKVILRRLRTKHHFSPSMGQLVHQMTLWHMNRYKLDDVTVSINDSPMYKRSAGALVALKRRHSPTSFLLSHSMSKQNSPGHIWADRQRWEALLFRVGPMHRPRKIYVGQEALQMIPKDDDAISLAWDHVLIRSNIGLLDSLVVKFDDSDKEWENADAVDMISSMDAACPDQLKFLQQSLCSKDPGIKYDLTTVYAMISLALVAAMQDRREEIMLHTNPALIMLSKIRDEYLEQGSQPGNFPLELAHLAQRVESFSISGDPRPFI